MVLMVEERGGLACSLAQRRWLWMCWLGWHAHRRQNLPSKTYVWFDIPLCKLCTCNVFLGKIPNCREGFQKPFQKFTNDMKWTKISRASVYYPVWFRHTPHIFPQIVLFLLAYRAVTSETISWLLHLLSVMSGCLSMLVSMDPRPGVVNQMIKAIKTNIYRSTLERCGVVFTNTSKALILLYAGSI